MGGVQHAVRKAVDAEIRGPDIALRGTVLAFPGLIRQCMLERIQDNRMSVMALRISRVAVIVLLGCGLLWQGVATATVGNGPAVWQTHCKCGQAGSERCSRPCCAARPFRPSSIPFVPVNTLPSAPNKLAALAASGLSAPPGFFGAPFSPASCVVMSASTALVPLFRRDCSYLL
jgi:hypothetical protein